MAAAVASSSTSTSQQTDTLKAATFQRLHPRIYLERFLAESVRPDGRALEQARDITVNVGSITTADGSSLVRLGDTTIVCGVKAEIAEPELDSPNEGYIVPNLDLPAICSPRFKPGPPSEEAQVLSDRLNEAFLASKIIDLSSLCIHSGKAVWVLYVDATCINYDGNAFDAALIALVAALRNTHLPKATYDEDTGLTVCSRRERIPLQINASPLSMSFGIFESTHLLADPTSFEEPLLDTTVTVVLTDKGELVSATQVGLGGTGSQDVLMSCIGIAKRRLAEVRPQIYRS
ncbi:hypothetical protein NEOLEDRAFT_1160586 [Neolentinus lepideus HHB14362 ss-1]|uniref:Ribosomal RNA-processing protein 43 n=1 Tax=Neolentinus lepideus HHB14362 ss-1 TaxID=1314782 RepID=A0A165VD55_9AGAM|nr:hypothetical protein NEOLEDRAFT_1160586 [Neolentinus lepideus HHB14362 ss-1]